MRDLAQLLKAETIKLSSTRTALGLFIAALALAVLPAILVVALVPANILVEEDGIELAFLGLTTVPMLTVVFGVLGMTNEYRHGTITYTYLTTPRRGLVIVVKLVCYAAVGAVVMALTGVLVLAAAWMTGAIRGTGASEVAEWVSGVSAADIAMFIVTVGLMTAFGVGLGALFRTQIPTVAGTLVWALIVEDMVILLKPTVGQYLPFTAMQQLTLGTQAEAAGLTMSRPEAFLVSIAYIAAASLLAVFISMRRDIT